jgi:hypothetical protein
MKTTIKAVLFIVSYVVVGFAGARIGAYESDQHAYRALNNIAISDVHLRPGTGFDKGRRVIEFTVANNNDVPVTDVTIETEVKPAPGSHYTSGVPVETFELGTAIGPKKSLKTTLPILPHSFEPGSAKLYLVRVTTPDRVFTREADINNPVRSAPAPGRDLH